MISTRRLQYILMLAIALPLSVKAELDIVQSRMLKPYTTPLRWDNIEHAPEWLRGTPATLKKDSRLHTIHLAPNDWVEVRIAGNETLRVLGIEKVLVQANLRILVSNGSGLYLEPTLQITADHKNWLAHADSNSPTIYRLENVGTNIESTESIEIALFASRHTYLGEQAPYRQLVPLPTDEVALHQSFEASAQRYWKLGSEQAAQLKVTGPRRLTLESRMHYPAPESKISQSWRVNAWLDDALLHSAEMESNAETLQEVLVDKLPTIVSRVERLYLDIPAGEHKLRLQSSAPLYARLLQQDSTDYSFPALNQPRLPAETARNNIDPQQAKQTSWLRSAKELQAATTPTADAPDVEQAALRLAMDNHWREGGLAGAALLNQAALAHPENQALKTRADTFAGAHTFFRDLLPKDKVAQADMTYRWFRIPRLTELGKENRNLVIAPQHTQDLLDHLGSGYFITLPGKSTDPAPTEPPQQISYTTERANDTVLFKNDSSHISAEEQSKLQLLAKRWHETNGQLLEVHGHTDSNAGIIYNQKLSERRADAVLRALTALGVRATIVNVAGYGKGKPVADNATSAGRQQNRRVEIILQRQIERAGVSTSKPADIALYQLPEAGAPRTLRIAAYADHDAEFFVQIDQQAIRRLRLSPDNRLALEAFPPTLGEGGLLLQQLENNTSNGTQSAAFARSRVAAPMIAAGIIELALPANSREVRLWRVTEVGDGLHVAVQYQASAAFQLSEREFLSLHHLDQDSGLPLRAALRNHDVNDLDSNHALLASQWRPLVRLLASEYRMAKAGVREQAAAVLQPINGASAAKEARAAEASKQWLLALEQWSKVWFSNSSKTLREEAEWGRINALQHLGEDFMFEQMLKQILFFDTDTARRIHAFSLLEAQYRASNDDESLLRLYAIAVQQWDDPSDWRKLTQSLLINAEFRLALLAGLALPPQQRPTESLLQASWRLGWWQTFDALSLNLKTPEQQAFWLGMRAIAHNQFTTASEQFKVADADGLAYVRHITQGLALQKALINEQPSNLESETSPLETYKKWLIWQTETPGQRIWRDATESIKDFAGALPGYAIDRDLHFSLYKATAARPLQLKVTGPAKLRLEVRPIHPAANTSTLEGWVTAKSAQGLWVAPITANQPTEGLQLVDGTIIGRKVLLEIPVAAGEQIINVNAGNLPIAVRVYTEQPLLSIGILHTPPLADVSDPHAEQIEFEPVLQADAWYRRCENCLSVTAIGAQQQTKHYRMINAAPHPVLVPEAPEDMALETLDREAQLLANNNFDQLLDNIPLQQDQPDVVLKRMTLLLNIAETSPKYYERCLAAGQALGFANPDLAGLSRLLDRLSRNSGWNAQETVQESAGVRLLSVQGWQPESPSSRTQKALLAPMADNEQVISGSARMVLSLLNSQQGKLAFELLAEDLGGLPPQPLQVSVQRDDEATMMMTLTPGAGWQKHSINLMAGRHALRFSIQNPVANQLLHIRLSERNGQPVSNQIERMYQVATAEQPIRAILPGPAWLRIDEWHGNQTQSRYQHLAEAWQTITLTPEVGQKEALYRLHLRNPAPPQPIVPPRHITAETVPVPLAPVKINDTAIAGTIRLVDEFKLGEQEYGTWTFAEEAHSRYDTDSQSKEKYLESSLSYRTFDEARQTYFSSQGLLRLHQHGDPTMGVKLRADHHPWGMPINAFVEMNAYAQTIPLAGNHWSLNLRAGISQQRDIDPKTWHTPWLTANVHRLGSSSPGKSEQVDQDIYTLYKSQHRFGYEIGDRLTYRPRLDTLLSAGTSVTSNENLVTPDKLGVNLEIKQLLGSWQADAHLTQIHYFKDADRNNVANRGEFGVGLRWEHWTSQQARLELLFNLNRNLQLGEITGWLGLRWHLDNGRAYRDFRSAEVDFRDLRERNIPNQPNNRIEAVEP